MSSDLEKLNEWLKENKVEAVAMESTVVYWKPIFNILESDFPVSIANHKLVGFQKKKGSAYSACYNNIAKRRGKKRALVALAHRMLMDIYRTLKTGEPYVDEGAQAVFERTFNYRYDPLSSAVSIPPLIQRPFDRSCI